MVKTIDMNKVIYRVVGITFSIMVFLLAVYGTMRVSLVAFDFGYRIFTEGAIDEEPGTDITVRIEENTGSIELGKLLYERGLVRDANLFILQHQLSAYAKTILPGTYVLNTTMTPKEMMMFLSDATNQVQETVDENTTETTTENTSEGSEAVQ